jgi:hypothetical protein
MSRFGSLVAAVFIAALGSAPALAAAAPAGQAVGVNPSASDVGATTRTLVVGSDVTMGDKVVTGPTGQVQLIFNDETHLVVGPASSLVIESYLLRGDKSVGKFAISALGGSFRFVTGQSDHSAYAISTPTGTIGVRGTGFDFLVDSRKGITPGHQPGTSVALFFGAVQVCDLAGKCVVISHQCDLAGTSQGGAFTVSHDAAARAGVRARFRYIASETPLLPAFRIRQSRLCYIDTSVPNSLATPGTGNAAGSAPPRGRGSLSP